MGADAVAISVPMHTAKRLADELTHQVKASRPDLDVAHYGLYAGVGEQETEADALFEGEYEPALVAWLGSMVDESLSTPRSVRHVGRSDLVIPDRTGLPNLESYARLEHNGRSVLAGAVEASHGCRHRCRHCPIPVVYDGRMRVVPQDVVAADIGQLVAAGAEHITFGDPDFLNAPAHSLAVIASAHEAHPEVTFDVTVKVEHILEHRDLWRELAAQNLLFVVSAFESVDDETLTILDKGHTVDDMVEAVQVVRAAGVHIRPTWLPFVPWTTTSHVVSMFEFLGTNDLVHATDPVQLSIKLLVPEGSLLEDHPAMTPLLESYDAAALTWRWRFADAEAETLQKQLEGIAAEASECGEEVGETLDQMRAAVEALTGAVIDWPVTKGSIPRLTESWFCCAEPTESQQVGLTIGPAR